MALMMQARVVDLPLPAGPVTSYQSFFQISQVNNLLRNSKHRRVWQAEGNHTDDCSQRTSLHVSKY